MAITKILARNSRLDAAINYVINGDKTEEHILTAYLNCDPGRAFQQMMETKEEIGKTGGNATTSYSPSDPARSRRSWR